MTQYRDEALPGTTVAGVDVAGLDRAGATAELQRRLSPRLEGARRGPCGRDDGHRSPGRALRAERRRDRRRGGRRIAPDRAGALRRARGRASGRRRTGAARATRRTGRHAHAHPPRRWPLAHRGGGLDARRRAHRRAGTRGTAARRRDAARRHPPRRVRRRCGDRKLLSVGAALLDRGRRSAPRRPPSSLVAAPVYVFFEGRPLRTLAPEELAAPRAVRAPRRRLPRLVRRDAPRARARSGDRRARAASGERALPDHRRPRARAAATARASGSTRAPRSRRSPRPRTHPTGASPTSG